MNIWIINHYISNIIDGQAAAHRHRYFAKELTKRGNNITLIYSSVDHFKNIDSLKGQNIPYTVIKQDNITNIPVKTREYAGNGIKRILNMMDFYRGLMKNYKNFVKDTIKPDIILASSVHPLTCVAGIKIAKKLDIPCIIEIRDLWPLSIVEYKNIPEKNPVIQILYKMEKWIYHNADSLIFTIPGGKKYITDRKWENKVNLDKIFNINNGIDLSEFNTEDTDMTQVDEDVLNDNFKVVYGGSIRTANCVDKLIDSAKIIKDKGIKDITYLIYGGGDKLDELKQKCLDENLDLVKFKGTIPKKQLHPVLERCNVAALTYKNAKTWEYGGSQNKVSEYLACGLPIVTNINMKFSPIEEHNCGIIAKDNPESIAEAILKIKDMNEKEYKEMSLRAKEVAKDYDFNKLTNKLEEVVKYTMEHRR